MRESSMIKPGSTTTIGLTRNQLLTWNAQQFWPDRPVLQDVWVLHVHGPIDADRFGRAWQLVVDGTDVLRTVIDDSGDEPVQSVLPRPRIASQYVDHADSIDPDAAVDAWVAERRRDCLDLSGGWWDAALHRLAPDRYAWYLCVHQIMADPATVVLLFQRLAEAYARMADGQPVAGIESYPAFQDHVAAEAADRGSERDQSAEAYWRAKIASPCDRVTFFDAKSPALDSTAQERVRVELGCARSERVRRLAREPGIAAESEHAAVASVFAAVLFAYLSRLTGNERVAVGVSTPNRSTARLASTAGPLTEQHALFVAVDGADGLASLAAKIRRESADVIRHQPFAPGNPGGTLYDVRLNCVESTFRDFAGIPARVRWLHSGHDTELLIVAVHEFDEPGNFTVQFDFNIEQFSESQRKLVVDHFLRLVDAWLADATTPLEDIEFLAVDECATLIARAGETDATPASGSLLEWIEAHAQAAPERSAIADEAGRSWSYGELWSYSGRIAAGLEREGIGHGDLVGVMVERNAALPGVLLGVLRRGAAYLPLDPDFPADRLTYMIENSGAAVVIADRAEAAPDTVRTLSLAALEAAAASRTADSTPHANDLAYVLYTSGSTGRPKGVEITHGALRNFLGSMRREPGLRSDDVLLAVTTLSFDISGLELYLPLCAGARVFIASRETAGDGYALAALLPTSGATVMQATPASWRMLIDAGWNGRLRSILCGGEALPDELARTLVTRADDVWNLYGPTETTVWSTIERITGNGPVLVGRPIANTRVYVLDRFGHLVPDGVHGEIWIGGAGVARGYRNRPDLTDERFRPDPFAPGGRMYRTGDLGRWRGERLEHMGRVDFQVKVHGYRIELGEIETALEALDEVRQAVVAAYGRADDPRLVAYVIFEDGRALPTPEVRRRLGETLPPYMVPGVFVPMVSFPLTPNGKVDRKSLPDPIAAGLASTRHEYEAPVGEVEQAIAVVWRELIGVERVGRRDNFFELGGHSLLVVKAVGRLKRRFSELSVTAMFQHNDLASLASALDSSSATPVLAGITDRAKQQRAARERLRARRVGDLR